MEAETIFSNLPIIETVRTKLRKINLFDTLDIYEYSSDPQVSKYLLWDTHRSTITTRKFISNIMQNYLDGKEAPWGIELKENFKLIGTVGFNFWDSGKDTAELGYVLSSKFWNQGYMSEIVKRVVDYGFSELNLKTISAKCDPLNVASQKVLNKNGFEYQGLFRQFISSKSEQRDLMLFLIKSNDCT